MQAPLRHFWAALGAVVMASPIAAQTAPSETQAVPVDASQAFGTVRSLVGVWRLVGKEENGFEIVFEEAAGGSVIVETWIINQTKRSFSVYHRDGAQVIATHYCPIGNQPRLALVSGGNGTPLRFAFQDVTNLESPTTSHLRTLEFALSKDGEEMVRSEVYLSAGREDPSSLRLRRYSED